MIGAGCAASDGDGPASEPSFVNGCRGISSALPRSIQEMVDTVNALPKPVELPCLLESLPRPLEVYATLSTLSAQQTFNRAYPRIFLFADPLIFSVVPDGIGASLLEMAEQRAMGRSIKAELEFPVETELTSATPYEKVMFSETNSTCAFCHADETMVEDLTFTQVFESVSLRPVPWQQVGIEELLRTTAACDALAEPEQCAMVKAIFGQEGGVTHRDFPAGFATFD
jgi:hypothetical protein